MEGSIKVKTIYFRFGPGSKQSTSK